MISSLPMDEGELVNIADDRDHVVLPIQWRGYDRKTAQDLGIYGGDGPSACTP